jgi:hypothetical protein
VYGDLVLGLFVDGDFALGLFVDGDFALGLGEAFGHNISRIFHELSPECFAPTGFTGFWGIDLFVWICAWGFWVGIIC